MPRKKGNKQEDVGLCVDEEVKIAAQRSLDTFRHQNEKAELEFPSSLTSKERAYIHKLAAQYGLVSKSKGKGANRCLTIRKSKKIEGSDNESIFEFGQNSCRVLHSFLMRFPVKQKERLELLPKYEKLKCGVLSESSGIKTDGSKTSGRLNNGIPQVPEARKPSDLDAFRRTLPVTAMKAEVMNAIQNNPVVLICGETGSGKTTQIPQFILDECHSKGEPCRILCTQPRRISAVAMAERVAAERNEFVGNTVGYQIRLESRVCPRTLLTFCTNGVLLRTLMAGDSSLNTVTHVIVDEVHERDRFSDFLMIKLRQLINSKSRVTSPRHQKFRLILMSAALDVQLFVNYFETCPVVNIANQERKLEKWCHELESGYDANSNANKLEEPAEDELANLSINSSSQSLVEADRWAIDAMNEALRCAWYAHDGEIAESETQASAFAQIYHLIQNENIPVDYQHNETGITALMTAAMHGLYEECERLLTLGARADLRAPNSWSAADMAEKMGHIDLAEIIASFVSEETSNIDEITPPIKIKEDEVVAEMSEEDIELVSLYHSRFNDDNVDCDLILKLIKIIHEQPEEGAILVFLPGYDNIVSLREMILSEENFTNIRLFFLHSNMQSSSDQKQVFKPVAKGFRKVVLSTNIAETAVTIDDVVYVIDSGKVKIKTYDAVTSMSSLKSVWVSQSSALQRKGRAGRCRPGECFRLFSRSRYASMLQYQIPEILRTPLHELCLQAKLLSIPSKRRRSKDNIPEQDKPTLSIADFLSKAPEAPSPLMIQNAVSLMKTIDALDNFEELTELGQHLVDLPIDPILGKMVLYSVVLKCLDPVLTIACALAYKDPFVMPVLPQAKREAAQCRIKFAAGTFSDHMSLLRAFQAWQKARSDGWEKIFCTKNYLSPATMEMIIGMRTQLLGQLRAAGFVRARGGSDIRDLNTNSENWAVVKAALCASSYPHILHFDKKNMKLSSEDHKKVRFHRSSTLASDPSGKVYTHNESLNALRSSWLIYDEMVQASGHLRGIATARCCTAVTPACVCIFAGPAYLNESECIKGPETSSPVEGLSIDSDSEEEDKSVSNLATFKLSSWIHLKMDSQLASMMLHLHIKWHTLFLRRIRNPAKPWLPEDEAVLSIIINILSSEDQSHNLLQPSGIGQRPRPMAQEDCGGRRGNNSRYSQRQSPNEQFNRNNGIQYYYPQQSPDSNNAKQQQSYNGSSNRNCQTPTQMIEKSPIMKTQQPTPILPNNYTQTSKDTSYMCFVADTAKNVLYSQCRGFWLVSGNEQVLIAEVIQRFKSVNVIIILNDIVQGTAKLSSDIMPITDNTMWHSWDKHDDYIGFVNLTWQQNSPQAGSKIPILQELRIQNSQTKAFLLDEMIGKAIFNGGFQTLHYTLPTDQAHAFHVPSQNMAGGDTMNNFKLNPYSQPYQANRSPQTHYNSSMYGSEFQSYPFIQPNINMLNSNNNLMTSYGMYNGEFKK